jgi:Uma2 family endonuclease
MWLVDNLSKTESEERRIITDVSWEDYEALLVDLVDRSSPHIAYLDGVIEIVSPCRTHESRKTVLGDLLLVYFLETDTPYFPMGSTTLKAQYKQAGVEPDESYCLYEDKEIPDLAIEVVVTSGSINRLELYGRLEIREVWFWQKGKIWVYVRRDGDSRQFSETFGYEEIDRSELLPNLDINFLQNALQNPDPLAAVKEFRALIAR